MKIKQGEMFEIHYGIIKKKSAFWNGELFQNSYKYNKNAFEGGEYQKPYLRENKIQDCLENAFKGKAARIKFKGDLSRHDSESAVEKRGWDISVRYSIKIKENIWKGILNAFKFASGKWK